MSLALVMMVPRPSLHLMATSPNAPGGVAPVVRMFST